MLEVLLASGIEVAGYDARCGEAVLLEVFSQEARIRRRSWPKLEMVLYALLDG